MLYGRSEETVKTSSLLSQIVKEVGYPVDVGRSCPSAANGEAEHMPVVEDRVGE